MHPSRLLICALIAGGLASAGCSDPTDLGTPCRLMQPVPDGGLIPISVNDPLVSGSANLFDFISTGDSDCVDLVCVRQAGFDYSAQDATGIAHGTCSNGCVDVTDCGEASKGLLCSQLTFDQTFLANLKQSDPTDYNQFFGVDSSSTYCVEPCGASACQSSFTCSNNSCASNNPPGS